MGVLVGAICVMFICVSCVRVMGVMVGAREGGWQQVWQQQAAAVDSTLCLCTRRGGPVFYPLPSKCKVSRWCSTPSTLCWLVHPPPPPALKLTPYHPHVAPRGCCSCPADVADHLWLAAVVLRRGRGSGLGGGEGCRLDVGWSLTTWTPVNDV